jgi:hypothetical protein
MRGLDATEDTGLSAEVDQAVDAGKWGIAQAKMATRIATE